MTIKIKRWEFAVLFSDEGFGGIQFLDYSSETCSRIMSILPKLRSRFKDLDETIKKIGGEEKSETENLHRPQPTGD